MKNTSKKTTKKPKPKAPKKFPVGILEARIDMENYEKLEMKLQHFKRDFHTHQIMYVDKLRRINDDQMDSLFIYYTKIHPDILLMKVDVDELPEGAQVGIIAAKRGGSHGGAIYDKS